MENGNRKQLNFKNIITRIFINCSLLLLFAELILSIHGKAYGYSEQILKNAGWISLDALLLAINLAIIGLMTYKLKSDCPMCKALAFTIITILSIACLSEICFIVYNGRMLTNSYSDALPK
jgi:hypothetical protein